MHENVYITLFFYAYWVLNTMFSRNGNILHRHRLCEASVGFDEASCPKRWSCACIPAQSSHLARQELTTVYPFLVGASHSWSALECCGADPGFCLLQLCPCDKLQELPLRHAHTPHIFSMS